MISLKKNIDSFYGNNIFINKILDKQLIRFIISGSINTFFTSLLLILLLNITLVSIATFVSDVFYNLISYFINSKSVFKKKGHFKKYLILVSSSWILRWSMINLLLDNNISKPFSVIIVIPFLALISFFIQKKFIFK